jgi:hypothetical protein
VVILLYFFTIIGALKYKMSMADIIDPYCVNVQMIKADKNNNTTANTDDGLKIIEIISPSEQCDVLQNGNINNNNKSENVSDLLFEILSIKKKYYFRQVIAMIIIIH